MLAQIVKRIATTPTLVQVANALSHKGSLCAENVPLAARPAVIAGLAYLLKGPLLIVVPRQAQADELAAAIAQLLPDRPVTAWATPETLPYDLFAQDHSTLGERQALLAQLLDGSPNVLVAPARALTQLLPAPEFLVQNRLKLSVGAHLPLHRLLDHLLSTGYHPTPVVQEPGTFSRRGGIIDIWPPGLNTGIRVEYFGDQIEALRTFDPTTQRSIEHLSELTILPLSERSSALFERVAKQLRALPWTQLRPEVQAEWERFCQRLERGQLLSTPELVAPLLLSKPCTLLDYLRAYPAIIVDPGAVRFTLEQLEQQAEELREASEQSGELPPGLPHPYWPAQRIWPALSNHPALWLGMTIELPSVPHIEPAHLGFTSDIPNLAGRHEQLGDRVHPYLVEGYAVVIATDQVERVEQVIQEQNLPITSSLQNGSLLVIRGRLPGGWLNESAQLLFLSDRELFGVRRSAVSGRRRSAQTPDLLSRLAPGCYVVHVDHGIARYGGLKTLVINGVPREYLQLEYAENDRLYLPVDHLDRITLYEGFENEPKLTRLGSLEWARVKRRVREAVRELAFDLLQLYAVREHTPGIAFGPDTPWDRESEESFPFEETPDQWQAIQEVKADMERPRPMDRLLCGDVGFGKTEVALRAAFKAVNNGYQVAVLVPTTILALQHYNTFRERLAAYPVRVEMLSRLRSKREQKGVIQGIREGTVDIVIGTHRLLQRDVEFKRLGLVIIDEEHRFGVVHKEHFKRLRTNVDVLTMTATPIPRTLYLALSGIRDLSLINTPPVERTPVRTFVTPARDAIIREAILRELSRGGQVYVVHNRVQSIDAFAARIQNLVPEARIAVAHGQMPESQLERIILSFIEREFDVLVCSAIIESGVDIPSVNTIIIDQAHQLGLTQLYQLRGRVGRSHVRAYAYLLYDDRRPLSPEAQARLEAIQEASELGAGLQIALRDLEIRGAGNILGPEQSGHIAAVGLELYTQLLARAVAELREGRPIEEAPHVSIDLPVEATIPPEYCGDEAVRMSIYQRFASIRTAEQLGDLVAELEDRFGPLPKPVQVLAEIAELRLWANRIGLTSILERDGDVFIRPVIGQRLSQEHLRQTLGPGVYVTPHQIRLTLDRCSPPVLDAVKMVLTEIEMRRATLRLEATREPTLTVKAQTRHGTPHQTASAR